MGVFTVRHILATALLAAVVPLSGAAIAQDVTMTPVPFGERIEAQVTDPLGIWSEDELAESQAYTRQWIVNGEVEVQGRAVVVSMLFGDLCSIKECPIRVVVKDGEQITPVLPSEQGPFQFELACQSPEQILIASDGSRLQACGAEFPLSLPSR